MSGWKCTYFLVSTYYDSHYICNFILQHSYFFSKSATIAGIIAGAVTGTHVSPISDQSVLSSYASRCQHQAHVGTQIPYASTAFLFAVLCGTLPIVSGLDNYVVLLIGLVSITIFSFVFGVKVDDKSGKYDLFTEMNLMCLDSTSLHQLKYDAAALENR